MTKVLSILFLVLCFSDGASAQVTGKARQVTASRYRHDCQSKTHKADLCLGYAHGYMDGITGMRVSTDDGTVSKVSFDGVTTSQVIKVVVAYIDRHPEILRKPISDVFLDAVLEAKLFVFTTEKQQRPCRDDVRLVVPTKTMVKK